MRTWLTAAFMLVLLAAPVTSVAQAAGQTPSIAARFETPRDFGYHIGDVIPLTLVIEAERGAVVDLESLPHRGQTVGRFEVRNVRISHVQTASGSAYRIEFALQTFVPATPAAGVEFPPLDLRFAVAEDRLADGGYAYRAVTLPPTMFFLSPAATGPRALRPDKGSVVPRAGWLFWSSVSLGALAIVTGGAMLARDLARWWHRRSIQRRSKAERRALATLVVLRNRYVACEAMTAVLFEKIGGVLRRFLGEQCGIPARVETVPQIKERFKGHPLEKEIGEVLERCSEVMYDAHRPTSSDKERIIREVSLLISELERVGCPTHGANGASR
jgi:hypothetical protein